MKQIKNENAVSPVISVILMVGITVLLATVIAAFVFGMSGNITKASPCIKCRCVAVTPVPAPVPEETPVLCGCDCKIRTKTSTLSERWELGIFGTNYLVDIDGVAYDWTSGTTHRFEKYYGHNVTFTYDPCNLIRGKYQILEIIEDHTCTPRCGCSCGCKS